MSKLQINSNIYKLNDKSNFNHFEVVHNHIVLELSKTKLLCVDSLQKSSQTHHSDCNSFDECHRATATFDTTLSVHLNFSNKTRNIT